MSTDTSRTQIGYAIEDSFAVLPATPHFTALRMTGETLTHKKATVVSNEIRPDRQIDDLVRVGASAEGAVNIELSMKEYRPFLLAALCQEDWTTVDEDSECTITGDHVSFSPDAPLVAGFIMGGFFKLTGASNAGNNGVKAILSIDEDGFGLTVAAGQFVGDESFAGHVFQRSVKNGQAKTSFTLERAFTNDAGDDYFHSFAGMNVNTVALKISSMGIITGDFGFIGRQGSYSNVSLSTYGLVSATGVLSCTANPSAGETVTIQFKTYTFRASVTTTANEILLGATATASLANLISAINGTAGGGVAYGSLTVPHAYVVASNEAPDVAATGTVTSNNTDVSNNDTVTVNGKVYTFKTALTPAEGEVHIGGSADASLLNLIRAINHTGTPDTDYKCAASHPTVSAAATVTAHAVTLSARTAGAAGNLLTLAKSAVTLSVSAAALTGGLSKLTIEANAENAEGLTGNNYGTSETLAAGSWTGATLSGGENAAGYSSSTEDDVVDGSNNVTGLFAGGVAFSDAAKELNFTVTNNLRAKDRIGEAGAFEVGFGQFGVTGSLNLYFEDNTYYAHFVNHEAIALSTLITDPAGVSMGILFPAIKFSEAPVNAAGNNQDVMMNLTWQGLRDSALDCTMVIFLFDDD